MYILRPPTNRGHDHRSIQEIRRKMDELANNNELVNSPTAGSVKGKIAGWKLELNEILQVFDVRQTCSCFVVVNHSFLGRTASEHAHHYSRYPTGTINIPSTQETGCETFPKYLCLRVDKHAWWYKESVERLQSQLAEVRPIRSRSTQAA